MLPERGIFAERLQNVRKLKKMPGRIVADRLGISYSAYTKYESGARTPDLDTLNAIANLFSVSTDYLLGRTSELITSQLEINDEEVIVRHFDLDPDELQARVERAVKKIMEEREKND